MVNENTGFNTYKSLPYKADLDTCDYVVAGIGFDSATSGQPGTRFAPDALRTCYWKSMGYNQNLKVETAAANGTDYGNIEVKHGYILPTFHMITAAMKDFLKHGVVTVILGGDHSITLPELRAMKEFYGRWHLYILIHIVMCAVSAQAMTMELLFPVHLKKDLSIHHIRSRSVCVGASTARNIMTLARIKA